MKPRTTAIVLFIFSLLTSACAGADGQSATGTPNTVPQAPPVSTPTPTPETFFSDQPVFEVEMDRPFGLTEGQTAVIPSEQLEITYVHIVEDTRCPGGVDCESRGELVIEYEVVKKERSLGRFALGSNSSPPSMAATRPTNSPSRGLGMVNDV